MPGPSTPPPGNSRNEPPSIRRKRRRNGIDVRPNEEEHRSKKIKIERTTAVTIKNAQIV